MFGFWNIDNLQKRRMIEPKMEWNDPISDLNHSAIFLYSEVVERSPFQLRTGKWIAVFTYSQPSK